MAAGILRSMIFWKMLSVIMAAAFPAKFAGGA
jgi:hypothetical protein